MKVHYKHKLFVWFLGIFTLFATGIYFFERSRERQQRIHALEERLSAYVEVTHAYLQRYAYPDSFSYMLPSNLRLTIIGLDGRVVFDNELEGTIDNHGQRPEIMEAARRGAGRDLRISESNDTEYLYYAQRFSDGFVRLALPCDDLEVKRSLNPDYIFLYFTAALFSLSLCLIYWASGRLGQSVQQLTDFTRAVKKGSTQLATMKLSKDELGEIGALLAANYQNLQRSNQIIEREREKLLQHVHSSEEGICFFSPQHTVEFYNGLFLQYFSTITDGNEYRPEHILQLPDFWELSQFLADYHFDKTHTDSYSEIFIRKHGKHFAARINIFDDRSFEITLNDITNQEKTRLLKQEMTGNITHELRTPVTGIRGCLETLLDKSLSHDQQQHFLQHAYNQSLSLSEMIQDMSLLTRIEDAPHSFKPEAIPLAELLDEIQHDFQAQLNEKQIHFTHCIDHHVIVKGNRTLLYAIFRNLTDNVVRYAGNDIEITVHKYNEDKNFYYFAYADNGTGIPEEHLARIFERFYRVDKGRSRDMGGSGLGLSIVKNSILFHKGTIIAKNKKNGGLEFLFKLPK